MKRVLSALCTLAVAAVFSGGMAWADDEPATAMNGKLLIVKAAKLAKFLSKPVSPATFPLPTAANDPRIEGGSIKFSEIGGTAELSASLPDTGWSGLGNPAGSKGFKYKGAGSLTDPCKVVIVKPKVIKGICKGAAVDFDQPVTGDVGVLLTLGTSSKTYCTVFGGTTVKNDAVLLKRKDALGQDACTCGAGNPGTFTFRNGPPTTANCGTMTDNTGGTTNLACNGLYIGSGSGTLTLPETVPDSNKALVADVDCCVGETLLLGPTTQAQTGDIETCTSEGCFFGAPLPLPNPMNPSVSTCVFNTYDEDVVGEANCSTGAARLDAPLNSATFLTGDTLPERCTGSCSGGPNAGGACANAGECPSGTCTPGTNPGGRCTAFDPMAPLVCPPDAACTGGGCCFADPDLQPCPICNPVTLICNGGFNNGMACSPDGGQNVSGGQFPTSHDCTISTLNKVGDLPVPFLLTTGTSTDTAVPSGTQTRVFCGHCRDANGTGAFGGCSGGPNNGMSCAVSGDCPMGTCSALPCESDADCPVDGTSRESCEQRNQGAFGPGGGANMTITEIGTPAVGGLDDFAAHPGTMVSVFCIPPSFNSIIDTAADIPGPGAVALPGTFDVNSPSGAFVDGSNLF